MNVTERCYSQWHSLLGLFILCHCGNPTALPMGSSSRDVAGCEDLGGIGEQHDICLAAAPQNEFSQIPSHQDWKNQLVFGVDEFGSQMPTGRAVGVKFSILTDDPGRVYFQDSGRYPLHYDFATNVFDRFAGLTPSQFDDVSLYGGGQQIILGTVFFPLSVSTTNEFAIQIVARDPVPPIRVAQISKVVRQSLLGVPHETRILYFPTLEQIALTRQWADSFARQGVHVDSFERWHASDVCYAAGWALGRLVFVDSERVEEAYLAEELQSDDILLTNAMPPSVPLVAGIITLSPTVPSSIAMLAQTSGIPLAYLSNKDEKEAVRAMAGQEVVITAGPHCDLSVIDMATLPPARRDELLAWNRPVSFERTPKRSSGVMSRPAVHLYPDDIVYFGRQSSNFGILARSIPESVPDPAIAFSFDLWDGFMAQPLSSAQTMAETIQAALAGFASVPDLGELANALETVRALITDSGRFSPNAQDAILAALNVFEPTTEIRFHPSTNLAAVDTLSTASRNDHYVGCLADDLDEDEQGPSMCDPTNKSEQGVFRALRNVFASFYDANAYLARRRLVADESEIGMAILAQASSPDEQEAAIGVITMAPQREETRFMVFSWPSATQTAAGHGVDTDPEIVSVHMSEWDGNRATRKSPGNVVSSGRWLLETEERYFDLGHLASTVYDRWRLNHPGNHVPALGMKYSYMRPNRFVMKQVRALPHTPQGGEVSLPETLLRDPAALLSQ